MRALNVTNTAIDLQDQTIPFNPGATVVVMNLTAGSLILQSSADNSTYATLSTVLTNEVKEITLNNQYIKVSTAATVTLLG